MKENQAVIFLDSKKSNKKAHFHGHRKRVRERFLKSEGKDLHDYEILEIILFSAMPRGDVKPLAKQLIKEFGSFAKVISAPGKDLKKINGIGEAAITAIKVAHETSLRILKEDFSKKTVIASWKSLLDYCRASMSHIKNEQFRIFYLDTKNQLISDEVQQEGTVDQTAVYPREVVKRALELGASAIILAHNHPSEDCTPSKSDIDMTTKIILAAEPLGVTVHDHIIIGGSKHFSFKSNGIM